MPAPRYQGKMILLESGPSTDLRKPPFTTGLTNSLPLFIVGLVLGGLMYLGSKDYHSAWLFWAGITTGLVGILLGLWRATKFMVAPCPYCGTLVGTELGHTLKLSNDNHLVECKKCCEWLVSKKEKLWPLEEDLFQYRRSEVHVPLFLAIQWPDECLTCGAPIARFDKLEKSTMSIGDAIGGAVIPQKADAWGIPYCGLHDHEATLIFVAKVPKLRFQNLGPMRRYLSLNFAKLRRQGT